MVEWPRWARRREILRVKVLAKTSAGTRDTGVSSQVVVSILAEGALTGFSHKCFWTADY